MSTIVRTFYLQNVRFFGEVFIGYLCLQGPWPSRPVTGTPDRRVAGTACWGEATSKMLSCLPSPAAGVGISGICWGCLMCPARMGKWSICSALCFNFIASDGYKADSPNMGYTLAIYSEAMERSYSLLIAQDTEWGQTCHTDSFWSYRIYTALIRLKVGLVSFFLLWSKIPLKKSFTFMFSYGKVSSVNYLFPLTVMGTHDIISNHTYSSKQSINATSSVVIQRAPDSPTKRNLSFFFKFYWHFISNSLWTYSSYICKYLLDVTTLVHALF